MIPLSIHSFLLCLSLSLSKYNSNSRGQMFDENSNASGVATPLTAGQAGLPTATVAPATPSTAIVSQLLNVKDSRWLQVRSFFEFLVSL